MSVAAGVRLRMRCRGNGYAAPGERMPGSTPTHPRASHRLSTWVVNISPTETSPRRLCCFERTAPTVLSSTFCGHKRLILGETCHAR
jgi:hypothetical protein